MALAKYNHRVVVEARARSLGASEARRGPSFPPDAPKPEEGKLNFGEVWQALYEGKWVILVTLLLVSAAVTAYTLALEPVYESSSVIYVETRARAMPGLGAAASGGQVRDLYQEVGILQQSRDLAVRVAAGIMQAGRSREGQFPLLAGRAQPYDTTAIALAISKRVKFIPDQGQSIIAVYAESSSPVEAAAIANQYARQYEQLAVEISRAGVMAKKKFVEEQEEKFWNELQRVQAQWEAFAQGRQVYTYGQEGERLVEEAAGLRAQRSAAQLDLDQAEYSLQLLERQLRDTESRLPSLDERVATSRTSSEIQSRINTVDAKIASLELKAEEYYINNASLRGNEAQVPELAEIVRQINYFREQRKGLMDRYLAEAAKMPELSGQGVDVQGAVELRRRVAQARLDVQENQQRLLVLDAKIGSYDGRLAGIPGQAIQAEELQREKQRVEQLYNTFSTELAQVQIAAESEIGYARVMQPAAAPTEPVRPNRTQNIALGIILGMGLGMGLAFVKSTMNRRLRTPEDLQGLGARVLGVIPPLEIGGRKPLLSGGLGKANSVERHPSEIVALNEPWSPAAENYRLLRTNIQFTGPRSGVRTLAVTSPEMGDGKTTTAVNLAVAMAQSGRRTVLVDADMRRPALHKLLRLPNEVGLADVLSGDMEVGGVSMATEVENLTLVPAGRAKIPTAELLGSSRMEELLKDLSEAYDMVILDTPPVLAVTDPVILAMQCDSVVLVASAEKTDLRALELAKQVLEAVGVHIGGTVLNRFQAKKGQSYSYAYSYNNASYGREEAAA